jgi:hypothetical protein
MKNWSELARNLVILAAGFLLGISSAVHAGGAVIFDSINHYAELTVSSQDGRTVYVYEGVYNAYRGGDIRVREIRLDDRTQQFHTIEGLQSPDYEPPPPEDDEDE